MSIGGNIEYVREMRKKKERVFETLVYSEKNHYSNAVSGWFARYMTEIKIKQSNKIKTIKPIKLTEIKDLNILKNIFLNFGVKGTSGYSFDSNSCYYYITKDGYVDSYLPTLISEKESFLEKFKNNIIDLNEFLIKQ